MLVGPSRTFSAYKLWADGRLYAPPNSDPQARATPPKGRFGHALTQILAASVALAFQARFNENLNYSRLAKESDPIQQMPLLYRIGLVQIAGLQNRVRYYSIWTLSNVRRTASVR